MKGSHAEELMYGFCIALEELSGGESSTSESDCPQKLKALTTIMSVSLEANKKYLTLLGAEKEGNRERSL